LNLLGKSWVLLHDNCLLARRGMTQKTTTKISSIKWVTDFAE